MMKKNLLFIFFCIIPLFTFAQKDSISVYGTISDSYYPHSPIVGATIILTGTSYGTLTNLEGKFQLKISAAPCQLEIEHKGYIGQIIVIEDVSGDIPLDIKMEQDFVENINWHPQYRHPLLERIGTYKKDATKNFSNFHNEQLREMPGLIINNSKGEVGRTFSRRGLGNEHFMFLEKGEPVTFAHRFSPLITQDMLMRQNVVVEECLIQGNTLDALIYQNTAGSTIEYQEQTSFGSYAISYLDNQFGVQANGREVYNKIGFTALSFQDYANRDVDIKGFLRYDGGNQPNASPQSFGGQMEARVRQYLKEGFLEVYIKRLEDKVGRNEVNFVHQWNDMQIADGFSWDDNWQLPDYDFKMFNVWEANTINHPDSLVFNGQAQQRITSVAIHVNFEYEIRDWEISNQLKINANELTLINPLKSDFVPYALDDVRFNSRLSHPLSHDMTSSLLLLGEAEFYDFETNEVLARVNTVGGIQNTTILENNLPNDKIIHYWLTHDDFRFQEFSDRFRLSHNFYNQKITVENTIRILNYLHQTNSSSLLLTTESQPRLLGLRVNTTDFSTIAPDFDHLSYQNAQFTNPSGLLSHNNGLVGREHIYEVSNALAVSDRYDFEDWIIQGGVRYEILWHRVNRVDQYLQSSDFSEFGANDQFGGLDGDELTVYDNVFQYHNGSSTNINTNYHMFSYHAGVMYNSNNNHSTYISVSSNEQLMTTRHYFYYGDNNASDLPKLAPRRVHQAEIGYRLLLSPLHLSATAFINQQKNVFNYLRTTSFPDNRPTLLEYIYTDYINYGLETSFSYYIKNFWSISGHFTLIQSLKSQDDETSVIFQPWIIQPISITNQFRLDSKQRKIDGNLFVTYNRLGKRFVNENQAFELPAFQTVDLGLLLNLWKLGLTVSVEATNVLNQIGFYSFDGMTSLSIPDRNFTPFYVENNPDEIFKVRRNLPRAFYFTVRYIIPSN